MKVKEKMIKAYYVLKNTVKRSVSTLKSNKGVGTPDSISPIRLIILTVMAAVIVITFFKLLPTVLSAL